MKNSVKRKNAEAKGESAEKNVFDKERNAKSVAGFVVNNVKDRGARVVSEGQDHA
ncbi:hypothetical protein AGMMS49949_04230 [Alphaproteobacteria bacterium]|nr:hypothetical protein AGMMS49949_04230 [Alphaproteobacteria bacterium]GHS97114.1 hypothetical protein AGMMS50296_3820 [Alphaproteobacteria bacterium]